MVKVIKQGVYYMEGRLVKETQAFMTSDKKEAAIKNTISYGILSAHNAGGEGLRLKADALVLCEGEDVLRTADNVGLEKFPLPTYLFGMPYGGAFFRSAAQKWGGEYIPEDLAVTDCYVREQIAKSGQLLFGNGSISCGALGAMAFPADEGDILRAFRNERLSAPRCEVVAVYLKGKLRKGVGPTDVALAIFKALDAAGGFADGKALELFGAGAGSLSMDYRNGIDSALGYSGCLSTVWATDDKTKEYFEEHLRGDAFAALAPVQPAYYDGGVVVDLSDVEPMIGVGGEILTVREFLEAAPAQYTKDGRVFLGGASIEYECATYETMAEVSEILNGAPTCGETVFCWFPGSAADTLALAENGYFAALLRAGAVFNDDVQPLQGLYASDANFDWNESARLDARTIAASLANGGYLTSALGCDYVKRVKKFKFEPALYAARVFHGEGKGAKLPLCYGDGIVPLPVFDPLPASLTLSVEGEEGDVARILDEPEEYSWSEAIEDRENGVRAILAGGFPEKLRTHLLDWGILPLRFEKFAFKEGDVLHLENIAEFVKSGEERVVAKVVGKRRTKDIVLTLGSLSAEEREILLAGGKNNLVRGK